MSEICWPCTGKVTQAFGENPDFYAQWGYPGHNGIDFGIPVGTAVLAAAGGVVELVAFEEGGYGNYVKLRHDGGLIGLEGKEFWTYYAHLRNAPVRVGQKVEAGEVIGYSGNTGASTGPHLHFGVKIPGANPAYKDYVDPMQILKGEVATLEAEGAEYAGAVTLGGLGLKVASDYVNVRSGPGTEFPIVGKLEGGKAIKGMRLHSASAWVEFEGGKFAAMTFGGVAYMELAAKRNTARKSTKEKSDG